MLHTDKSGAGVAAGGRSGRPHTYRKSLFAVLCCLFFVCFMLKAQTVSAETRQAELVKTDIQQDLAVMFTFDTEIVDLVFISPSGQEKTASDPDVSYVSGDLWSTYRISQAEAGVWSVRYDLKGNSGIDYSIIEDNSGLWLQYLEMERNDSKVSLKFRADCESKSLNYTYTIYAVNTENPKDIVQLLSGRAQSDKEISVSCGLDSLSGGNYVLRVDVYCQDGDAELFDSLTSEPFDYTNPRQPAAIEDFALAIDLGDLTCSVDWSAYAKRSSTAYKLLIYGDDELIYSAEPERGTTASGAVFPKDAGHLTVELSYQYNKLWSAPLSKTVSLEKEYLRLTTGDVTNSGQAFLEYLVTEERTLNVNVNGVSGSRLLQGSGTLSVDLEQGANTIRASFTDDASVSFTVNGQVYFDAYPPEIKLYENLDGKTFYTDSADIIGKISDGNRLLVGGNEVEMGEAGEFRVNVPLAAGENIISIEAWDANGNSSLINLTLRRASAGFDMSAADESPMPFLPLFIALAVSLAVVIMSAVFMKKRDKSQTVKKIRLWKWILWDIALALADAASIYGFVVCYQTLNSESYLEMIEKDVSKAIRYLQMEQIFAAASIALSALLLLGIVITVFRSKKKRKAEAQ